MKFKHIFVLSSLFLSLAACSEKEQPNVAKEDNVIEFGVSSSFELDTKTQYSGEVVGSGDSARERIDWLAGDQIKVFMYKDYDIYKGVYQLGANGTVASDNRAYSNGSTKFVSGDKLMWGDAAHDFYAIYPAASDKGGFTYWGEPGQIVTFELPSAQLKGEVANMENAFMVASKKGVTRTSSGKVSLDFYPVVTTLAFSLRNDYASGDMTIKRITLKSTDGTPLAGSFSVSLAGDNYQIDNTFTGTSTSVSIDFDSEVIAKGSSVKGEFFLLPQNYNPENLQLTVLTSKGASAISLKNSAISSFQSTKKYNLSLDLSEDKAPVFEITEQVKILLANAFPDLVLYTSSYGSGYELRYKNELGEWDVPVAVPEEDIYRLVQQVTEINFLDDYGLTLPDPESGYCHYNAEVMALFTNLEKIIINNQSGATLNAMSLDGNKKLKEILMEGSSSFQDLSVKNCPLLSDVTVTSQSLNSVTLEGLPSLENITVLEGETNSNLKEFKVTDCPNVKSVDFGLTGALKTIDLSGLSKMETLKIGLAYALESIDLTGCSSLKSIDINAAQSLTALNVDDCTDLESIVLKDPQKLASLIVKDKLKLHTINIENPSNSDAMTVAELVNLPSLTSLHIGNSANLSTVTLSKLPAAITSISDVFPLETYDGVPSNRTQNLSELSISECPGFVDISLVSPSTNITLTKMSFTSCANLVSVSLEGAKNANTGAGTTSIVATKKDCPKLNSYYTVTNGGVSYQYPFTVL